MKRGLVFGLLLLVGQNCRKAEGPPVQEAEPEKPQAAEAPPEKPKAAPTRIDFPVLMEDPGQWLFVQKVAEKAKGAWATGSFDADRNKLRITTTDVEEFSVDTSRIQIDWQKLVVLSIDGRNSELKRRDVSLLHFVRSPHGEWTVREP